MKQNGVFTSDNKYETEFIVPCYDADSRFFMKPSAFMDHAQEMAYLAATYLGFGYDDLQKHHTAWVLSRFEYRFINTPKWRDSLKLQTWHKGFDGLFALRDFRLLYEDGTPAIVGTSSWLVIDVETRRMVRSDECERLVPPGSMCLDDAIEERAPKVVMPRGVEPEFVKDHVVGYSDLDFIGHTNNARYIVWAMNAIDPSITFDHNVLAVRINFNKETTSGETVSLYRFCREEAGRIVCTVEGRAAGKAAFVAEIDFAL